MSIGDIFAEPLKIYKLCNSKEEQQKKVREIMDVVGLAERTYGLYPHELDGGRRQRVGIARALILDPKLVVCDEPVSALDVSIQAQILNLMMELQKERNLTYLFITHNLSVVKHISDDITVMYLGQMVEKAGSAEIFAHQYHPYTKALISAIPLPKYNAPDNQIILKGEITSPINVTKSCRFAPRCVYAKPECFENEPQLEEIEKDFDKFLEMMKWNLIQKHYVNELKLEVTPEEATQEAKALAMQQFAYYGMNQVADDMLANYAKSILENKEESRKVYEKLFERKVIDAVVPQITVTDTTVTPEEFAKLAEKAQ